MKRFFGSISELFKRTRREDPIFGSMLYMGDRLKYWEGRARFSPTDSQIEVFVDGAADDDMAEQHEFFEKLVADWPRLREEIWKMLGPSLPKRNSKEQVATTFDQLRLSSISIPKGTIETAEWELSFDDPSSEYSYTVHMKGYQSVLSVVED